MDFLNPQNIAGQSLLQLVSRGSSIITEILRLSEHVHQNFLVLFTPIKMKLNNIKIFYMIFVILKHQKIMMNK